LLKPLSPLTRRNGDSASVGTTEIQSNAIALPAGAKSGQAESFSSPTSKKEAPPFSPVLPKYLQSGVHRVHGRPRASSRGGVGGSVDSRQNPCGIGIGGVHTAIGFEREGVDTPSSSHDRLFL
jgi:hypothetical protein